MAKGKYARKKAKKPIALIVAIVVLLFLLFVGVSIFIIPQWLYSLRNESENHSDPTASSQIRETGSVSEIGSTETELENTISFPISVADGKLEITSFYAYNGINPDCGNQEGTNIAAITVKNTSDAYLSEGNITLTLSDGTIANFKISDLPSGTNMFAFSTENTVLAENAVCIDVTCEAEFDPEIPVSAETVSVSTDGIAVTLTNVSERDLKKVVVYCHNILNPDYFGGITYIYNIENLPAGASTTVDAIDCILGLAEVVRIDAE